MGTRPGTLLEKYIEEIFQSAGFSTRQGERVNGYDVDVLATHGGLRIVVECKQYERAHLPIRNLIHEWDSKNKEIGADRIILAIYGQNISHEERALADKYDMVIWDDKDIDRYKRIARDQDNAAEIMLDDLGLIPHRLSFLRNIFSWYGITFMLALIFSGFGMSKLSTSLILLLSFAITIHLIVFLIKRRQSKNFRRH